MAQCFFVILITALLAACGRTRTPDTAETTWTTEQLHAFQQFKSGGARRHVVAEAVARSFPTAFDYDQLRVTASDDVLIPQERLIELLGVPATAFSLVDRPGYLGASGRPLDFDPRELRILLYDVDCLAIPSVPSNANCSYVEAIVLKGRVLRVRVARDRREDAGAALAQPQSGAAVHAPNQLIAQMPRPGWTRMQPMTTSELVKSFASGALGYAFYEHRAGDAIYGRVVAPFQRVNVSSRVAVCLATAKDVFVPTTQAELADGTVLRDTNILIVVFEPSLEKCVQRYREGAFVRVTGGALSVAQLAKIHDLFSRRLAAQCDVPAWMTPQGLMAATGGIYNIDIPVSPTGRDRWSFDVHVRFSLARDGAYDALMAIRPWGVRLKECAQLGN